MVERRSFILPREDGLGLHWITNRAGLAIGVLPNGCLFAIEHRHERGRTMINQVQGSALAGGIARLYVRIRAPEPFLRQVVGPGAKVSFGAAADHFAWQGEADGLRHRVGLWLHPQRQLWLWRLEVANSRDVDMRCDALLVQDVGLGACPFVMTNEAFVSQYIDHHIALDPRFGPVVMSRQNLAQYGGNPWVAHGCFDRAAALATDAMQLFGPGYRDADDIDAGIDLPSVRLQHEVACPMIQAHPLTLRPDGTAAWTFFGLYQPDHPAASSDADLSTIEEAEQALAAFAPGVANLGMPVRSLTRSAATSCSTRTTRPARARTWRCARAPRTSCALRCSAR